MDQACLSWHRANLHLATAVAMAAAASDSRLLIAVRVRSASHPCTWSSSCVLVIATVFARCSAELTMKLCIIAGTLKKPASPVMKYSMLATGRKIKYATAINTADRTEGAVAGGTSLSAPVGRWAMEDMLMAVTAEAELAVEGAHGMSLHF